MKTTPSEKGEPLIFTRYYHSEDTEEDIQKWYDNHPSMQGRTLICDESVIGGFECDCVIGISSFFYGHLLASRARVQYIQVKI